MIITRSNLERVKTPSTSTKPTTGLAHRTFATTAITTLSAQAAVAAATTIIRVAIDIYASTVTSRLTRRAFAAATITTCTIRTNIAAATAVVQVGIEIDTIVSALVRRRRRTHAAP